MATRITDDRLEEIRHRIDRLREGAESARAETKASIKREAEALRSPRHLC